MRDTRKPNTTAYTELLKPVKSVDHCVVSGFLESNRKETASFYPFSAIFSLKFFY